MKGDRDLLIECKLQLEKIQRNRSNDSTLNKLNQRLEKQDVDEFDELVLDALKNSSSTRAWKSITVEGSEIDTHKFYELVAIAKNNIKTENIILIKELKGKHQKYQIAYYL